MPNSIDSMVLDEGNREAFELVLNATKERDEPLRLAIYGPVGTGKTTLLKARADEKDLLSKKRMAFCHSAELVAAIAFDAGDEFFERIGSSEVLFLDAFEDFFADDVDPTIGKLLLAERMRLGLDTVIVSNVPFEDLDLSVFDDLLDSFEFLTVKPLGQNGRREFVTAMRNQYCNGSSDAPDFDESAIDFLATEFADDLVDVRYAIMYLVTAADLEPGTVLDAATVKHLLNVE